MAEPRLEASLVSAEPVSAATSKPAGGVELTLPLVVLLGCAGLGLAFRTIRREWRLATGGASVAPDGPA